MNDISLAPNELLLLLRPIYRRRYVLVVLAVVSFAVFYAMLRQQGVVAYQAEAMVLVRFPLIEEKRRVDPNPVVASAFVDLARSDGVLAGIRDQLYNLQFHAENLNDALRLTKDCTAQTYRQALSSATGQQLVAQLPESWMARVLSSHLFVRALLGANPDDSAWDLSALRGRCQLSSAVAQETNISVTERPFLILKASASQPELALLTANLWAGNLVSEAEMIFTGEALRTEQILLSQTEKLFDKLSVLLSQKNTLETMPEYAEYRRVHFLENWLYGDNPLLAGTQPLAGHDSDRSSDWVGLLEQAGKSLASILESTLNKSTDELFPPLPELTGPLTNQLSEKRIANATFAVEYENLWLQIQHTRQVLSELPTTAAFVQSVLRGGYALPPLALAQPAALPDQPRVTKLSVRPLLGMLAVLLFYMAWIYYHEILVPVLRD